MVRVGVTVSTSQRAVDIDLNATQEPERYILFRD
jgi:hypothetical protein